MINGSIAGHQMGGDDLRGGGLSSTSAFLVKG